MLKRTPLYQQHVLASAQMSEFSGWEMPLNYGSQLLEHRYVRNSAGMFDVSHMCAIDILGEDAFYLLRVLLANDIHKLKTPGRALYTCMLNTEGGILDDMIVYRLNEHDYRLVVNAGSAQKILAWLHQYGDRYVITIVEQPELAMLAVQGPSAIYSLKELFDDEKFHQLIDQAKPFTFFTYRNLFIARTGYTGEDGVEIILENSDVAALWKKLLKLGVKPCGLGARDTLRLEAGLNLYGVDMDESTTPLESNLAWTVSWDDFEREFIGKHALQTQLDQGVPTRLVGVVMEEPGVLRNHQKIYFENETQGEITSGGFSPTLGHAVALARVPTAASVHASVDRRGKKIDVTLVKPPFIKRGKKTF